MMRRAYLYPTKEDAAVWASIARRQRFTVYGPSGLLATIRATELRDADLMLELVELRSIDAYANVRQLQTMAGEDGCSVGGWMGHYRWISDKWSDGKPL